MNDRLSRLDGLRGWAIFGVIAVHSGIAFPTQFSLAGTGQYGVQLFFLISGFILTHVATTNVFQSRKFFIKRFFRLAPMYYLVLVLCYLFNFNEPLEPSTKALSLDLTNFVVHLTFMHGLHPDYLRSIYSIMWSLTPEVVFYLFFPLLILASIRTLWLLFALSLCLAIPQTAYFLWGEKNETIMIWAGHSPLSAMFCFIFGMLVFRSPAFFSLWRWQIVGFVALVLFLLEGAGYGTGISGDISRVILALPDFVE